MPESSRVRCVHRTNDGRFQHGVIKDKNGKVIFSGTIDLLSDSQPSRLLDVRK